MIRVLKKKKGIEAGGFSIIIGIIIILLSAGIILWVVQSSASKADEKTRVETCRISNEIRVGTEDDSRWWFPVHSPRMCGTIDKATEESLFVPSKKYPQNKMGAEYEIGDMLKNCWYMWLEGADRKVFPQSINPANPSAWGRTGCHVCYMFKIKDGARTDTTTGTISYISYNSIITSLMNRVYFALDSSMKCAPNNVGGFFRDLCITTPESQKEREVKSKMADLAGKKCCIRDNPQDVCWNKGGQCCPVNDVSKCINDGYTQVYDKWFCPSNQLCYVKLENYYSYFKYLFEYGKRKGGLFPEPSNDAFATPGNIGAISVYSGDGTDKERPGEAFLRITSYDYAVSQGCEGTKV